MTATSTFTIETRPQERLTDKPYALVFMDETPGREGRIALRYYSAHPTSTGCEAIFEALGDLVPEGAIRRLGRFDTPAEVYFTVEAHEVLEALMSAPTLPSATPQLAA